MIFLLLIEFLEVLEEYRHPDIVAPSGIPLQLDFFYPRLKLAFEYQVQQNNVNILIFKGTTTL